MIKSRTHTRGMPERNKAQCRARARGQQDARVARGHEGKTDINPKVAHGREGHIHRRGNNGTCARACHKTPIISRFVGANVGAKNTISDYLIVIK